jgi:hypothetical protein
VSRRITPSDTPFNLARDMLGNGQLQNELVIPGWSVGAPLPVGAMAYVRGESDGPAAPYMLDPATWGVEK